MPYMVADLNIKKPGTNEVIGQRDEAAGREFNGLGPEVPYHGIFVESGSGTPVLIFGDVTLEQLATDGWEPYASE